MVDPTWIVMSGTLGDLVRGQRPARPLHLAVGRDAEPPQTIGDLGRVGLHDGVVQIPQPFDGTIAGESIERSHPGVCKIHRVEASGDHARRIPPADPLR